MKKKGIITAVCLLAVGFAAVSTTLYINGTTNIGVNTDDFQVYYSQAKVNNVVDNSVITDDTHIVFAQEMKEVGETYTLEYDVTNGSKNYDASVSMNCTGSSEYLSINNSFDTDTTLESTKTRTGTLTVELVKSFVGTSEDVSISCEINANAVERTTLATGTPAEKVSSTVAQVSFADDSWETIAKAVKSGSYIYQVGDTKTVDMGDLGTHTVRVANTSACTNGETSETACGFVVEFADIITTYAMNSNSSNVGGWPASEMRTYVNSTVYNALPSDLQSVIAETTVVSGHGSTSGEDNFTSTDKLYLLSAHEVWSDGTSNTVSTYDTSYSETRQLDYYANLGVTTSNYSGAIKQYNGSYYYWWLRSAYSANSSRFIIIYTNGAWAYGDAAGSAFVSPAFRIV